MYSQEETVVFSDDGAISHISETARTWLSRYCQEHDFSDADCVPAPFLQELMISPTDGFAVVGHDGILEIAFRRCRRNGSANLLLLRTALTPNHCPAAAVLTHREKEVFYWLLKGLSNAAISQRLGNSRKTVEKHIANIYLKLGVENRAAAICRAFE
jgi:DNA-binding NarL/FixJ family response regulator